MNEVVRQIKPLPMLSSIICVGLIGLVDHISGYDVSWAVFYAFPVIYAVWQCGRLSGAFIALLSVIAWFVANDIAGHSHGNRWIPIWNCAVRFSYLMLIVIGAESHKRQLESSRARARTLEGILPICTSCKRIQDEEGYWSDLENYIEEHSAAEPESKLCPDCAKRLYVKSITPR